MCSSGNAEVLTKVPTWAVQVRHHTPWWFPCFAGPHTATAAGWPQAWKKTTLVWRAWVTSVTLMLCGCLRVSNTQQMRSPYCTTVRNPGNCPPHTPVKKAGGGVGGGGGGEREINKKKRRKKKEEKIYFTFSNLSDFRLLVYSKNDHNCVKSQYQLQRHL